jgi:hypothetical protein
MNSKRTILSLALLITVVFGLTACKGANKATGANASRSTTIKATVDPSAAKSLARHGAKRAVGTVAEIATITADIYNGPSVIATGLPLSNNNGVWSAVVSDLPVGAQLTFNGHANNGSAQEIFRGTTLQTLSSPDDEVVIRMEPVQSGTTLPFLQISQIGRPASIAVTGVVPVSVSVVGNAGETLAYQVTAAENGGTFGDASGSITLAGTSATIVLFYTAPATEGTYLHSLQVTDAHGNSVQTTFDTVVVAGILDPTILVQFNPVITALTSPGAGPR